MNKVNKITLNNFKFFLGNNTIEVDSKNLLVYGENGSGKSSIYWALYTFLHSVYKNDDLEIKKYFDPTKDENLINRFAAPGNQSALIVEFIDETLTLTTKEISFAVVNTKSDNLVKEAAHASDFVNYRILSRLYDFSNRDQIDLFPLFEKEILMFMDFPVELTPGVSRVSDWWLFLKNGMQPRTNMHTDEYIEFQGNITQFNDQLNDYLLSITQTANEYLQDQFKQRLRISFSYQPASYDAFEEGSTTKRNHKTIPPKIILSVELLHGEAAAVASFNLHRPQSFLNEARLTAIALSIRFSIIDEKYINEATKILVFDDLLVSLDMSNRDIVLEIILNEFPDYQIIMMTHDRMFFELAKHKVKKNGNDNWAYYEMYESVNSNILVPFIKKSESYLEKAKANFHRKEFEMTGNFLRKQAEKFTKELLPKKYHFKENYVPCDLDELITQCSVFAKASGITKTLFEDLDGHRKFVLNPTSHDNISTAQFRYEIERCIKTFDELAELKFDIVIKSGEKFEFELIGGTDAALYKWEILTDEDVLLLKWPSEDSFLGATKFANKMYRNGILKHDWKYSRNTIDAFYTNWYGRSDKTKTPIFWDEIFHSVSGDPVRTMKIY